MQTKSPILLITVALGLLAIGGAAFMLMQSPAPPPEQPVVAAAPTPTPEPREVFVANRDIPPRTVVTSAMLRRSLISENAPPDALTSLDDIATRITKEPIRFGETVKLTSFGPRLRRQVPANFEIPSGFRAVSIWVDPQQTAAGLVDIGDRVDVVATHRLQAEKQDNQIIIGAREFSAGRMIARNLLVLAVDKSISAPEPVPTPVPQAATAPGANPATGGPPPVPTPVPTPLPEGNRTRVLLAAPPDIATRLVAANDQGKLHIVIRNPSDADAAEVPEAREYPSRTVFLPNANTGGGGGNADRPREPRGSAFAPPPLPAPDIQPLPPAPTGGTGPTDFPAPAPADPSKEVTVIRGTEKTRVIVPER